MTNHKNLLGHDAYTLSRRSLLRMSLAGGALMLAPGSLAFGQDDAPKRGGAITIGADADPIGFNPLEVTAFSSFDFTSLLYSGLLRWTPEMGIEPDLATSFEQPDPLTYIFHLKQGVKFHNGQDFTAEDVKFTFERILDPEYQSPRIGAFSSVKSVTVVDDYTVRFELDKTDAPFLSYIATNPDGAIVPRGDHDLNAQPIGTGPFKLDVYTPGQICTLKAHTEYFEEGQPYLDEVHFRFFKDQGTLSSALRSRTVDMIWLRDPRVAAQVARTSPDIVSAPGQTSRTFPIWLNLEDERLADVRVRRALSLGINREVCLQTVLSGSGKVAATLPESHVGGYDGVSEMPYYKHDPAGAKALLAEAGYPDGIDLGEYIVVAANQLDVACAQIIQEQWLEAGIKVELRPMETAPLLEMWTQGTFPTLLSVAYSWSADSDVLFSALRSDLRPPREPGEMVGAGDAEYDAMVAAARQELDVAKRAEMNLEIQRHIADNVYALHIYQYPLRWEMWWNKIEGYKPLAANIRSYVRTAWVKS